jgi:hypothetical protein
MAILGQTLTCMLCILSVRVGDFLKDMQHLIVTLRTQQLNHDVHMKRFEHNKKMNM